MRAVDLADTGVAETDLAEVYETWTLPRFQVEKDAWIVLAPDGKIAAYAWAWDRKPHTEIQSDSYVAPGHATSGLEEALLDRIEERAEEHRSAAPRSDEMLVRAFTSPNAAARVQALRSRGFEQVRTFCRMVIDLPEAAEIPRPQWPAGIEPHSYVRGRDEPDFDRVIQESFADHFGFVHEPHAEWTGRRIDQSGFDAALWTIAREGAEAAGAILAYRPEGEGWVRELGVRSAWRGRGLGRALLLHTFALFAARGIKHVGLGVDMANTTGATQLYESVGMRVAFRHDLYERRLGPGRGT
ncbi:MAG: GNAT family N-acetyltransferase [Bacteroidota bacterium]